MSNRFQANVRVDVEMAGADPGALSDAGVRAGVLDLVCELGAFDPKTVVNAELMSDTVSSTTLYLMDLKY